MKLLDYRGISCGLEVMRGGQLHGLSGPLCANQNVVEDWNLKMFNISLLAKWRWRFLNDTKVIWADILKVRYGDLRKCSPDDFDAGTLRKCSLWWRDLRSIGDALPSGVSWFRDRVRRRIGNGDNTEFWTYSWIGTTSLKFVFPELYHLSSNREGIVESMGEWAGGAWVWRWQWD